MPVNAFGKSLQVLRTRRFEPRSAPRPERNWAPPARIAVGCGCHGQQPVTTGLWQFFSKADVDSVPLPGSGRWAAVAHFFWFRVSNAAIPAAGARGMYFYTGPEADGRVFPPLLS